MRVLGIIVQSSFASQMQSQRADLVWWINEILTGVWQHQVGCGVPPASDIRLNELSLLPCSKATERS
jgi:hypothetical protein